MDEGTPRQLLRRPSVAGVAGGVGTTVLAHAIGGLDHGLFRGRPVDVLVCRATGDSLARAARIVYLISSQGRRVPVLAVNTADAVNKSRPLRARIRLMEPHTAAVVTLPSVPGWRDVTDPLAEIAGLLSRSPAELPRPLRRFADAVRDVVKALDAPPTRPSAPRPSPHLHVVRAAGRSRS